MKKQFFLLGCVLFSFTKLFSQTTIDKLIATRHDEFTSNIWKGIDSTLIFYNGDGTKTGSLTIKTDASSTWNNWFKYTYTLSATNKITQNIRENWNGSAWVNNTRYTYTFDGNDNNTLIAYDVWNGTAWAPTGKIEYTGYNASGMPAQENVYIMNGSTWTNSTYNAKTYIANMTKLSSEEKYMWDNTFAYWKKIERNTYTYVQDSIGTIFRSIPDSNNAWVNESKVTKTWNTTPQYLLEEKKQIWDTTTNGYLNSKRTTYYYTPQNKIDHTLSEASNGSSSWDGQFQSQYVYDAGGNKIEYFDQWYINGLWENSLRKTYTNIGTNVSEEVEYLGNGGSWNTQKRTSFLYDANNNNTFKQIDSFQNGSFQNDSRYFYYYGTFPLSIHNELTSAQKVVAYPNPTTDALTINFTSTENFTAQISISDITGKTRIVVLQPIQQGENSINTSLGSLPMGNYILSILDGKGKAHHQKIQVIK